MSKNTVAVALDKEQMAEIIKEVITQYDKQRKENSERKRDRRLRNTDLLLRNYSNLMKHIDYAVEDSKKLDEEDPEELLSEIEEEVEIDNTDGYDGIYINAIKRTKIRTAIIVKHIDTAISFYKQKATTSKDENLKRRYDVIYKYYFEKKKITAIAKELNMSDKTVGRDKKKAVEELGVLFFGVDGMRFRV